MKKQQTTNNMGLTVQQPKKPCQDQHCPFHSSQKLRGRLLAGQVKKIDAFKTATITFERIHPLPKYERYEKRTSRLRVHNPLCLNAQPGDKVLVAETRPISKTKSFVIIEVQK